MYTKEQATIKVNDLCETLNEQVGGKWEGFLWYNSGWYFSARLGSMEVYQRSRPNGELYYSCMVHNRLNQYGGTPSYWWNDNDHREPTPGGAVAKALKTASEFNKKLHEVIANNYSLLINH